MYAATDDDKNASPAPGHCISVWISRWLQLKRPPSPGSPPPTIFSQRPQQIGENLLCESEFCACSGFRRSSRDSSAAALHIGQMLSRVALTGTIVRLGEALPVVFFSSAVDFILPVNCWRSQLPFEQRRVPPAR